MIIREELIENGHIISAVYGETDSLLHIKYAMVQLPKWFITNTSGCHMISYQPIDYIQIS